MTPRDPHDHDDDDLTALFGAIQDDGPSPDPAVLAQLREQSLATFLAATPTPSPNPTIRRRRSVLTILLRVATASVAAMLVLSLVLRVIPSRSEGLAQALDRFADADSLHLQVIPDITGPKQDVWVAKGNKLRREDTPEKYQIVQGPKSYRVDESTNRVTPGIVDYFRPDRPGVDLFALLGLQRPTPDTIRTVKSSINRTLRASDGQAADVYRVATTDPEGAERVVEIVVNPRTQSVSMVQVHAPNPVSQQLELITSLLVLAQGQPIPEEKFVVKPTLAEDGRVGKIVDVQGLVSVKPVGSDRWTPVRPGMLLMPGDWVRADVRGANAATIRLLPQARITMGPGGLVEVLKPNQITLHEGEAEIHPAKGVPIAVTGPTGEAVTLDAQTHFRAQRDQLVRVEKEPLWLKSLKGTTTADALGSLVAQVDGRAVPLSVGYHKVSVEIRDQIARTTIEESFVNHTDIQLEGQFHFPLPQDASIAGFAMDVNGEMVEADVVEKQRAREIFEEIMRERRDPGLLEWTGGNIFKARVWPIFPHSAKRVKITYTQVLPLQGKQFRYSYALQSEMLQQNPLKELAISLQVYSAVPLKAVTSPTHSVRSQFTPNAARLDFAAQEHTPTRDFEAVIEVAEAAPAVSVIPHRRGADGYFLLQVTPPSEALDERPLVASVQPMRLMLVCDTSASITPAQRHAQHAVVAALLETLTPRDTFNLATCDVNTDWAFDKPQPATADNLAKARNHLMNRVSLGWTDLDRTFAAVLPQVGAEGHVVYLGDGILTTGDANPQAFAQRLAKLYQASQSRASFHAIALSSSFEPPVLKAIASLGGGSMRKITTEQGPVAIALELLAEMTRPPVRDLKVEFRNWKTARVYPETLTNLVPGTQQTLIGRYLPEAGQQQGEVVVSGTRNGQRVQYTAKATLDQAESGNSFLPRLWARLHLDRLLDQPQTPEIKDDIIALSEEFHILTPYTSFLVLESDADRARFSVKRRFQMKDGEEFFAQGRDQAQYALAREQMRRAAAWRTGVRREMQALFQSLGRMSPATVDPTRDERRKYERTKFALEKSAEDIVQGLTLGLELDGGGLRDNYLGRFDELNRAGEGPANDPQSSGRFTVNEPALEGFFGKDDLATLWDRDTDGPADRKKMMMDLPMGDIEFGLDGLDDRWAGDFERLDKNSTRGGMMPMGGGRGVNLASKPDTRFGRRPTPNVRWFDSLFAPIAAPVTPSSPPAHWPEEARTLSRSLLRREALAPKSGGLKIERQTTVYHTSGSVLNREQALELVSAEAWVVRTAGDRIPTLTQWADTRERGAYYAAYQLGRVRAALPADRESAPLAGSDFTGSALDESYRPFKVTVETAGDLKVLVLVQPQSTYEARITIDPTKKIVVKFEDFNAGQPSLVRTYTDPVEVNGTWWTTKQETTQNGRRITSVSQSVTALTPALFAEQTAAATADRATTLTLRFPGVSVATAKANLAKGSATLDDRFTLVNHYAALQQWTRTDQQLTALEKAAADKPGLVWMRMIFTQVRRQGEDLRSRLLAGADTLATRPAGDRLMLANFLFSMAQSNLAGHEQLELLERLKPAYADLPPQSDARLQWLRNRIQVLQSGGQPEQALALSRQTAQEFPEDYSVQSSHAYALFQRGDHEAALAFVREQLAPGKTWASWERNQFRSIESDWLERAARYPDWLAQTQTWMTAEPESEAASARHLAALLRLGDVDTMNKRIGEWISAAQTPGELTPATLARFRAAVALASGRGHNHYTDRILEPWTQPLAEAFRFFATHPKQTHVARQMMSYQQLLQTDAGRRMVRGLFDSLVKDVDTLPMDQLSIRLALVDYVSGPVDPSVWKSLIESVQKRVASLPTPQEQWNYREQLLPLVGRYLDTAAYHAYWRAHVKQSPAESQAQTRARYYQVLLSTPWSGEREAELFALLPELGTDRGEERPYVLVAELHVLSDKMLVGRYQTLLAGLKNPEKLTRTELAAKHKELQQAASRGLAERLAKAETEFPELLRPWAQVERQYRLARADSDPKALAEEVWTALGAKPQALPDTEPRTPTQVLDQMLQGRRVMMAMEWAGRTTATPEMVTRMRQYLEAGIQAEPASPVWKMALYQFLIVRDDPQTLEARLTKWIADGDADGTWRLALGYILAEQGKLPEAIRQFESVAKTEDLGYSPAQALASWYLATDRKAEHEAMLMRAVRSLDESILSQRLAIKVRPFTRGGTTAPPDFDPEILRLFTALFEKATYPANYLHQLRQVYGQTRDFRLLATMVESVRGQSAGAIYPFLTTAQSVLSEVRDEATAEQMLVVIETQRATTKSAVDLRALDLLEAQVRRRMAEVTNQPGPQAEKAILALKRAFARDWARGEPLLMSALLRDYGTIGRADLAAEQLRELRELVATAKPGTSEHLQLVHNLALVLGYQGQHGEAFTQLRSALQEYTTAAFDGRITSNEQSVVSSLISFAESRQDYKEAETLFRTLAQKTANDTIDQWLALQLYELYLRVLDRKLTVTLGSGAQLYQAVHTQLVAALQHPDPNHVAALVGLICRMARTAQQREQVDITANLTNLAEKVLPAQLQKPTPTYHTIVSEVARTLRDLIGPEAGMVFLLDRLETEPAWLRMSTNTGWANHGTQLAQWRHEAKNLTAKTGRRLLDRACDELRDELRTQTHRNRHLFQANYSYYWAEQEAAFAEVAEKVYRERKDSLPAVLHIAEYFFSGCNRPARAIELLQVEHQAKRLDANQQLTLVKYLTSEKRHAEAVTILAALVETSPETLYYRAQLCTTLHAAGQKGELVAAFTAAERFFREKSTWAEPAMSVLAHTASECGLHERVVAISAELIPLHQRTAPRGGVANGTLSQYYVNLARAQSALGDTVKAVDAASGAIVAWAGNLDGRRQALATLQQVLTESKDLSRFVEHLDQQTGESGLINPVIRKAVGQAFYNMSQFRPAILQLQAALSVQPNDAETQQLLIKAFDALKDADGAIAQILRTREATPRDLALYRNLGERYSIANRSQDAERAYTSIVEVTPTEAEGHAMLADVRQKQDRWKDAIPHWEQVAKIRALEPTGLLGLAAAQLHLKEYEAAAATLAKLKAKSWPAHFPNAPSQIAELERQLDAAKR